MTYYFTQKVLAQYPVEDTGEDTSWIDKEAVAFVKKYGAYLQIHSCLSCSAAVKAVAPINEILQLARHDPTHRDAVREIQKSTSLTFYDAVSVLAKKDILVHSTTHLPLNIAIQGKLSAALFFLSSIRSEKKIQRREVIRSVCVSAYPDIQPWQARKACFDLETADSPSQKTNQDDWLEDYYYGYLSMLLHPQQGNEAARSDSALVKVRTCNARPIINCFLQLSYQSYEISRNGASGPLESIHWTKRI